MFSSECYHFQGGCRIEWGIVFASCSRALIRWDASSFDGWLNRQCIYACDPPNEKVLKGWYHGSPHLSIYISLVETMHLMLRLSLYVSIAGIIVLTLARVARISRNYNLVKSQGLPIIILPWSWQDPIWMLLSPYMLWLQHLPGFSWVRYSYMGWTTKDKARAHRPAPHGLGPAFIVVSPSRTEFFTVDPQTSAAVTRDWHQYAHPKDLYAVFGVFGNNVLTVNGADWQRHRKIVGGAFREAIYPTVWDESRDQARGMVETLLRRRRRSTLKDVRQAVELLAMHVLSAAAFGRSYAYGASGLKSVDRGHRLSYMDCMRTMYPNLMGVILFGGLKLPLPDWVMPNGFLRIREAVEEYKLYLLEAVQRQQTKSSSEHDKVANLTTLLVRANDIEKDENLASGNKVGSLSDDELYGNMFAFNAAGYETTAMTLSFLVPYLAIYPQVQDWAREEVDAVFHKDELMSYEEAYEKLPRIRALMVGNLPCCQPQRADNRQYETLRLHSSVAHLPRESPSHATMLEIPSLHRTLTIPPTSLLSTPVVIAGYLPNGFNGGDPYLFHPKRFLKSNSDRKEVVRDDNELLTEGWMPWTTGPRGCPGKKFSQVEFVSVVSELLLRLEIKIADWRDEGEEKARERLNAALADTVFNLGTTINHADQVGVEFVPR